MITIDLNCDMGEGIGNDQDIMPFITSANIACGFHAGNTEQISQTISLALHNNVHIGAHPSFRDKEHFGRREMHISHDKLYAIILEQLIKIDLIAREKGAKIHHVKPHGALYNMASRNIPMAYTIAQAVMDFDPELHLYGLSGSYLVSEAERVGLKTQNEVFADRTYQDDGSLTPRQNALALIDNVTDCIQQVEQILDSGTVTTLSGKSIPILCDTICIHGDGKQAAMFAKKIHELIQKKNIVQTT